MVRRSVWPPWSITGHKTIQLSGPNNNGGWLTVFWVALWAGLSWEGPPPLVMLTGLIHVSAV